MPNSLKTTIPNFVQCAIFMCSCVEKLFDSLFSLFSCFLFSYVSLFVSLFLIFHSLRSKQCIVLFHLFLLNIQWKIVKHGGIPALRNQLWGWWWSWWLRSGGGRRGSTGGGGGRRRRRRGLFGSFKRLHQWIVCCGCTSFLSVSLFSLFQILCQFISNFNGQCIEIGRINGVHGGRTKRGRRGGRRRRRRRGGGDVTQEMLNGLIFRSTFHKRSRRYAQHGKLPTSVVRRVAARSAATVCFLFHFTVFDALHRQIRCVGQCFNGFHPMYVGFLWVFQFQLLIFLLLSSFFSPSFSSSFVSSFFIISTTTAWCHGQHHLRLLDNTFTVFVRHRWVVHGSAATTTGEIDGVSLPQYDFHGRVPTHNQF